MINMNIGHNKINADNYKRKNVEELKKHYHQ